MGVAMFVAGCGMLECRGSNAVAADNLSPAARIFGEEGCKDKNDFYMLKKLGDVFQRELKPVLQSGLMTPEKFDAMYQMSDLNQWLKQHEASDGCRSLKDGTEIIIDERSDQICACDPEENKRAFGLAINQ